MSLIDFLTPAHYRVLRLGIQRDGGLTARYDLMILNAAGRQLEAMSLSSVLTQGEQDAIVAMFQRDQAQFEANTGLTEWQE